MSFVGFSVYIIINPYHKSNGAKTSGGTNVIHYQNSPYLVLVRPYMVNIICAPPPPPPPPPPPRSAAENLHYEQRGANHNGANKHNGITEIIMHTITMHAT